MKNYLKYLLGVLLVFPLTVASAFGLSLKDFKNEVYRPENLPAGQSGSLTAENKIVGVINFLVQLILYASGSIAVLILIYSAIRLIVGAGEPEQKEQAIKIMRWAGTGLLVVILAYALVSNLIDLIFRATT